jgi:hypothetical protein
MSHKSKAEKKPFDLTILDTSPVADSGSVLEVLHPVDNTPIGITITVAGIDSDLYRKTANKMQNKRTQRIKPGQPFAYTAEEQEADRIKLAAACTLAWTGVVMNGEELPCTPDNVMALYSNPGFSWLLDQVNAFMGDRANFLRK